MVNDTTDELSVTGYILSQRDFMDDLEFAFGRFRTYQVPLATIENQIDLDFGPLREADPLTDIESTSFRPLTILTEISL